MCTGFEILAGANFVKGVGGFLAGKDEEKQRKSRVGEILESSKQEMKQTARAQSRRIGSQKAAFGKAGVKLKGSAAKFIEEQRRQDEIELLNQQFNTELDVRTELQKGRQARTRGALSLVSGVTDSFSALGKAGRLKGFALGG